MVRLDATLTPSEISLPKIDRQNGEQNESSREDDQAHPGTGFGRLSRPTSNSEKSGNKRYECDDAIGTDSPECFTARGIWQARGDAADASYIDPMPCLFCGSVAPNLSDGASRAQVQTARLQQPTAVPSDAHAVLVGDRDTTAVV